MQNQAMRRKLDAGKAIDLARCMRTAAGDYILEKFVKDRDYCDAQLETWIWSIAKLTRPLPSVMADGTRRTLEPGTYLASNQSRFYHGSETTTAYECVWLR
jgi:hypothetical protein